MAQPHDKRESRRDFCSFTLEYTYTPRDNGSHGPKTSRALTTNVSPGGIGIFTDRPLPAGDTISVFSRQIRDTEFGAEVRWCRRISDTLYRVGLLLDTPALAA